MTILVKEQTRRIKYPIRSRGTVRDAHGTTYWLTANDSRRLSKLQNLSIGCDLGIRVADESSENYGAILNVTSKKVLDCIPEVPNSLISAPHPLVWLVRKYDPIEAHVISNPNLAVLSKLVFHYDPKSTNIAYFQTAHRRPEVTYARGNELAKDLKRRFYEYGFYYPQDVAAFKGIANIACEAANRTLQEMVGARFQIGYIHNQGKRVLGLVGNPFGSGTLFNAEKFDSFQKLGAAVDPRLLNRKSVEQVLEEYGVLQPERKIR